MNPYHAQVLRAQRQDKTHEMVMREVTHALKGRGPISDIEHAFVRAVYAPDRRLRKIRT